MKIVKRILLSFFVLLAIGIVALYAFLFSTKPKLSGTLRLSGLSDSVEVYFDKWGVPHIYASKEEDAYMAFGYVHAQDRLFQMEMLRRASSGRLSEVLGPDLLEVDKLFRTLGLNKFAQRQSELFLQSDTSNYQRAVHAYIRGVNQFIRHGKTPLEFSIIGIPKTEFVDEDVYSVIGFMALGFAEGFDVDPVLTHLADTFGTEYLKDFALETPPDAEIIPVYDGMVKQRLHETVSALRKAFRALPVPLLHGSNGWVIGPDRSASGFPILVNDTHIGFSQPAVWYEAHLEYPGFRFYGHHLAGLPFGILGTNDFCGWGLTMFENDDVDFFIEEINPQNPNQVRFKDAWENLLGREEVIKVKGGQDVPFVVRESRHGPLVNGIVENVAASTPIALSWTLLKEDNYALQAAYELGHASTFTDAQKAASKFSAPGLNVMYGDKAGNIAWWACAKLPVRPPHVNSKLFLNGANGEDEYLGYYSFEHNPKSVNPPSGFVYSANNQPDSVKGVLYPGYYFPRSRAQRIVELIENKSTLSVEDMKNFELDETSAMHAHMARVLASLVPETAAGDEPIRSMQRSLSTWDGTHAADSMSPAVYYTVLSQWLHYMLQDELTDEAFEALLKSSIIKNSLPSLLANENSPWWDDIRTTQRKETRGDIMLKTFEAAANRLVRTSGADPKQWRWDNIHPLTHRHALAAVKPLDRLFNVGPFKVGGGSEVINNLDFLYDVEGTFDVISGPALRKITDFSDVEAGVTVSPTGQSGNVMSPHYDDQAAMFVNGTYRPMMMRKDDITAASENKLLFLPMHN